MARADIRCRANMAHIRQSGPDSGRGLQARALEMPGAGSFMYLVQGFEMVASSLQGGAGDADKAGAARAHARPPCGSTTHLKGRAFGLEGFGFGCGMQGL